MRYGVPYAGSKNKIAAWVMDNLPPARFFVDVFAGGCAVTHAALLSGKYERFIANDLGMAPQLFLDAIRGKYKDETRWISREEFHALKDTDAYVKYCWSFGCKGEDYLYGRKIEPYKRACHYAVMFDDFTELKALCPETAGAVIAALDGLTDKTERRTALGWAIVDWLKRNGTAELFLKNPLYTSVKVRGEERFRCDLDNAARLASLERLESLERLQSLERLERLQSLTRLEATRADYQAVFIPKNSVIYADPPYKGTTNEYGHGVDYEQFYQWCERQTELVVISEYDMPADRFTRVAAIQKRKTMSATNNSTMATEGLYVPKRQESMYYEMMGRAPVDEFYRNMRAEI